jgi:tungstate transport system substrate-binding protein
MWVSGRLHRISPFALLAAAVLAAAACVGGRASEIILVTTTSTQDSGLLDALIPVFESQAGYQVKTIAIGTGQALATGARGEADVALTHAPELEQHYVTSGAFISRRRMMHNDFVLVGPPADPAGLKSSATATEGLACIARGSSPFVSRADNSGTHLLEQKLWKTVGSKPDGPRYIETGQGMGATLLVASEKSAYTLTDRGTFLAFRDKVSLDIVVQGDPVLVNVYHVMDVNPSRFPMVNATGARALSDFLLSERARAIVDTFGVATYGSSLFFPDAARPRQE